MISQANINWISQLSGVPVEEISGALAKEEEVSLGLKLNGRVISQDEERTIRENGIQQGKELGYKDIAKGLSIDLASGEKDPAIIAEKIKTTVTTTLEDKYKNPQPGEREKELESKLEAEKLKYNKLFGTHEEILGSVAEKEKAFNDLQTTIKTKDRNAAIAKSFPEKMAMEKSDALLIFTNTFEVEEAEGKMIVKRDGQIVTDSVGQPEKLENIVPSFVEEKKWIKGAGMGGGDRSGGGSKKGGKTADEAFKILKEMPNIDPASPEGLKLFNEMTAKE